jgi:hypothetical protein
MAVAVSANRRDVLHVKIEDVPTCHVAPAADADVFAIPRV